jgi:hypothetical protein
MLRNIPKERSLQACGHTFSEEIPYWQFVISTEHSPESDESIPYISHLLGIHFNIIISSVHALIS